MKISCWEVNFPLNYSFKKWIIVFFNKQQISQLLQLKYFFVFKKKVADFLYLTLPNFLGLGTVQRTSGVHLINQSDTHCLSLGYLVGCCEIWLNDCVGAVIVDYHLILLTKHELSIY